MAEPIRQEIRVDYDGQPVEDAARDMDRLGREAEAAGQQAEQGAAGQQRQSDATRKQAQELRELIDQDVRHRQAVEAGKQVTEQDTQAVEARRQRIEQLTRAVARERDIEDQVNRELNESVEAHRASARATEQAVRARRSFAERSRDLRTTIGGIDQGSNPGNRSRP